MGITLDVNVHVVGGRDRGVRAYCRTRLRSRLGSMSRLALLRSALLALVVIFAIYGSRAILTLGLPRDAVEIVGFAGLVAATIWAWRMKKA